MAENTELQDGDKVVKMTDTVKFKVGYGKDFKGDKYLTDGDVFTLHRLHAQRLQDIGAGSIQTDK